jgi:hypothetical protein
MTSDETQQLATAVATHVRPLFDAIHARIDHLSIKVQVTSDQAAAAEARQEARVRAVEGLERGLRATARTLSDAVARFAVVRAVAMLAPRPAQLVAMGAGAALGGFAATWAWLAVHSPRLLAMALR